MISLYDPAYGVFRLPREALHGKLVRIWSGEHRAYWGPDSCGYYDRAGADTYLSRTWHCGPEKRIAYEPIQDPRDLDYTHEGIFIYHNCARCQDGKRPDRCPTPERPGNCGYPQARDD